MEFKHLRAFLMVAEELHFTRAAERLHMAQQPLSVMIKRLEEELGTALFARTSRKVTLTEAGVSFQRDAKAILSLTDQSIQRAHTIGAGTGGMLRLGYSTSTLNVVLPAVLQTFREKYPAVEVQLSEHCSPELEALLVARTIDVALLCPPVKHSGLALTSLYHEPFDVVLPVGHPLAGQETVMLSDLRGEALVLYQQATKAALRARILNLLHQENITPTVIHDAATEQAVMSFVAAGLGWGLVPRHTPLKENVRLIPLAGLSFTVEIAVAHRSGSLDLKVNHFVKNAQETLLKSSAAYIRKAI